MQKPIKASIIIPTLGRGNALQRCLSSLERQTLKPHEIITVTEEGELASLRNSGASKASGDILVFIDDDTFCPPTWLESLVAGFHDDRIGGCSGPAIIKEEYRCNRDIFSHKLIKKTYDLLFLEGRESLPGHITRAGTWTTGACDEECNYEGEVQFLEACNMAFRADIFKILGGFDESYKGVGDWSEPDLAFRFRRAGFKLWFSRDAKLYHEPSKSGAFNKRKGDAPNRMGNYELFSKRWVKPCFRHTLYKWFMKGYYAYQTFK